MKVLAWLNFIVLGVILFIAAHSLRKEEKKTKEFQEKIKDKEEQIYQLQTRIEKEQMLNKDALNQNDKVTQKIADLEKQLELSKKETFEVKQRNDALQKDLSEKESDLDRMIQVLKKNRLKI